MSRIAETRITSDDLDFIRAYGMALRTCFVPGFPGGVDVVEGETCFACCCLVFGGSKFIGGANAA